MPWSYAGRDLAYWLRHMGHERLSVRLFALRAAARAGLEGLRSWLAQADAFPLPLRAMVLALEASPEDLETLQQEHPRRGDLSRARFLQRHCMSPLQARGRRLREEEFQRAFNQAGSDEARYVLATRWAATFPGRSAASLAPLARLEDSRGWAACWALARPGGEGLDRVIERYARSTASGREGLARVFWLLGPAASTALEALLEHWQRHGAEAPWSEAALLALEGTAAARMARSLPDREDFYPIVLEEAAVTELACTAFGPSGPRRVLAVRAMGGFGPDRERVVPALATLVRDPDPEIRLSSMESLVACGLPDALAAMRTALKDPLPGLRELAEQAVARLYAEHAAGLEGLPSPEHPLYPLRLLFLRYLEPHESMLEDPDPEVRREVLLLFQSRSPELVERLRPRLEAMLAESDEQVLAEVVRTLGCLEPPAAELVALLTPFLRDPRGSVATAARQALTALSLEETLLPYLASPDREQRVAACETLRELRRIPRALLAIVSRGELISNELLETLKRALPGEGFDQVLAAGVEACPPGQQHLVCYHLALGGPTARGKLLQLTASPDESLRLQAVQSLEVVVQSGEGGALWLLENCQCLPWGDSNPRVRAALDRAADRAASRARLSDLYGGLARADKIGLLQAMARSQLPSAARVAATVLGLLDTTAVRSQALDSLTLATLHPSAEVRLSAVQALGGWTGEGGIDALRDALGDADPGVRAAAVAALGRQGEPVPVPLLADPAWEVRLAVCERLAAAARAGKDLRDLALEARLLQLLQDESPRVRAAARDIMEAWAVPPEPLVEELLSGRPHSLEAWELAFALASHEQRAGLLRQGLRKLHGGARQRLAGRACLLPLHTAMNLTLEFLRDPDPTGRSWAAEFLCERCRRESEDAGKLGAWLCAHYPSLPLEDPVPAVRLPLEEAMEELLPRLPEVCLRLCLPLLSRLGRHPRLAVVAVRAMGRLLEVPEARAELSALLRSPETPPEALELASRLLRDVT